MSLWLGKAAGSMLLEARLAEGSDSSRTPNRFQQRRLLCPVYGELQQAIVSRTLHLKEGSGDGRQ